MFIDKVRIYIKSGDGGSGCVSFHTEKFVPNGGPDGGDGGKGGDIVFVATSSVNTLNEFYYRKHFRAENGEKGDKKKCYGKQGKDLIITVPVGTIIRDCESGRIIADMFSDGQKEIIIRGGQGGKGNYHFATSRRRSPSFAQLGVKTLERNVELELKTIADVGLLGFPSVGKSTLLSVISNAKPKIAEYHFTTLNPNLGMVNHYDKTFLVADIPGLIEGASQGQGLGHEFLRHIERTRMLIHVIDMGGTEGRNPIDDFIAINKEIANYSSVLAKRQQIVAANKMDMSQAEENLKAFTKKYGKKYIIVPIIAPIHEGIKKLLDEALKMLDTLPQLEKQEYEPFVYEAIDNSSYEITCCGNGVYEVTGGFVENLNRKTTLDDEDSFRFFQRALKRSGLLDELRKKGAKDGDTIIMGDTEFDFVE